MVQKQKGFTLIELLVVIAIIGILATIVLGALGSARTKANDTKVQAQLSSMRAQANLYTNASLSATAVAAAPCVATANTIFESSSTNNGLGSLLPTTYSATYVGSGCYSDATLPSAGGKWAVAFPLGSSTAPTGFACVDYTGASKTSSFTTAATAVTAASYTCN